MDEVPLRSYKTIYAHIYVRANGTTPNANARPAPSHPRVSLCSVAAANTSEAGEGQPFRPRRPPETRGRELLFLATEKEESCPPKQTARDKHEQDGVFAQSSGFGPSTHWPEI